MHTRYVVLIAILLITAGFIWGTFKTEAPYQTYVTAVVSLAGLYGAKRTYEKKLTNNTISPGSAVPSPADPEKLQPQSTSGPPGGTGKGSQPGSEGDEGCPCGIKSVIGSGDYQPYLRKGPDGFEYRTLEEQQRFTEFRNKHTS